MSPELAQPRPVRLIIFDCDGVLIDSEIVVCRLTSEELGRVGYHLDVEAVIERYAGRPEREMVAEIERDWGQTLPEAYFTRMRVRIEEAYAGGLRAMPGAADLLRTITLPSCVASSSYPQKLRLGLTATGLEGYFGGNLVSATYVAHGKPAPDVFIYAAGWMRVPVEDCLVIEDSIPGVRAARAAGMRVFGFTGGSHCRPGHAERLVEAGAERVLPELGGVLAFVS